MMSAALACPLTHHPLAHHLYSWPLPCMLCLLPQSRLKEERAKLEAAVTAQLEEERAALLHKKRREQVGAINVAFLQVTQA